jgi:Regulator of ribonuclease activity B
LHIVASSEAQGTTVVTSQLHSKPLGRGFECEPITLGVRGILPGMTMFDLLHQNALADTDLLRKNDKLGDIFTTPREVDFAFETGERQRADDFPEFVNGKSYGKAEVSKITDDHFRVLVLITMPITQHLIGCVSGFMLCLSRLFQIGYLGWGSVVQKP